MIRKENIDIKEMNRRIHSNIQLKPDLNAFPVKDVAVPFNSNKIMASEFEVPASFQDQNMLVQDQINQIKENIKMDIQPTNLNTENTKEQVDKLLNDMQDELEVEQASTNNINANNNVETNVNNNLEPNDINANNINANNNVEPNNNVDNVINALNKANAEKSVSEHPIIPKEPVINNKFMRSVMDLKRNTSISKTILLLFLIVMGILIYFGIHKKVF